jgi:hypothetical protein
MGRCPVARRFIAGDPIKRCSSPDLLTASRSPEKIPASLVMSSVLSVAFSRIVIGVLFLHGTFTPLSGSFSFRCATMNVGVQTSHANAPCPYFEETSVGLQGLFSATQYFNKFLSFLHGKMASRFAQLTGRSPQSWLWRVLPSSAQFVVRPFWRPLSFGNGALTDPLRA